MSADLCPETERVCGRCGERKPPASFPRSSNRSAWCKACGRAHAREWRQRNPEKARQTSSWRWTPDGRRWHCDYRLWTRYGLTREAYDELVLASEGRCGLCDKPTELVVDHCHDTGRVRGLLCGPCNRALGSIGDTEEAVRRVLAYLGS